MSNEKKYTREEIRAIVEEELRKAKVGKELSLEEMENVSGGRMLIPATHEEIDRRMDIVQTILDSYGFDVAFFAALELDCMPDIAGSSFGNPFRGGRVDKVRNWMHRQLDGTNDGGWITIF